MSSLLPTLHSLLPFCLVLLLTGCAGERFSTERGQLAIASTSENTPSPAQTKPKTKTLKLRLSLDSPADLLMKEGEAVSKGQVICDRKSTRIALEGKRQGLNLKLRALEERAKPKFEEPVIEPEPSYGVELAKVEAARAEVQGLEDQVQGFEQGSGYTAVAWRELPMQEQRNQLLELRQKLAKARTALKLATAGLKQAQDDYRRRVKVAQAKAKIPIRETINPVERLQVLQELKMLEGQISTMGRVRVSQPGVIKKVKWLGMQDQTLQVEISLGMAEKR